MSEVTNNFYISGNYIAEQHIDHQVNNYTGGTGDHVSNNTVYPRAGDYNAVVQWLEAKKQKGEDYYAGSNFNRSEMCRKLTKIFGWEVDESGIRKAQERMKQEKTH